MTLLGKVFTAIIFVLSVVFFALSIAVNATHISNKKLADTRKAEADTANREKQTLMDKLETVKRELAIEQAARRTALASLQSQLSQLSKDNSDKEKELRDLISAHTAIVATEKTTSETLKARIAENDLLRDQIKTARDDRNQLFSRLVTAKDQFNRLQGEFDRLSERWADLNNDHNLAMNLLQTLGVKPDTDLSTPPAVNGEVLAVATDGTVTVSLGQDDGIREKMTLDVHRSGQYLGKVEVTRVTPNQSIGRILIKFQKGPILAGDRVDSKLY